MKIELWTDWFSNTIFKHTEVVETNPTPTGFVEIIRRQHPPVTIAPLGNALIDTEVVEHVLKIGTPDVIALIQTLGHYDWPARELARAHGSSVLTMSEIYSNLSELDLRDSLDTKVSYNKNRIEQHSRVRQVEMICESSMVVHRSHPMESIRLAVEYEYELTEMSVVTALNKHPGIDVILNANPNGGTTLPAAQHATTAGVSIFKIGELMGALNYSGSKFRNYRPSWES